MSLSFADLPENLTEKSQAPLVVVPIPLEKTVTYQRGTRNGPSAIIKASGQLEIFDQSIGLQTGRVGIHTASSIDCRPPLKDCVETIYQKALEWFSLKKFPVFLGGEHSISIGIFKALRDHFGPITIVQVDAHADLRHSYHNSLFNHACVMARAREYGHRLIQVGVRALSEKEYQLTQSDSLIHTFFDSDPSWKTRDLSLITKHIQSPAYLTIDVDGLDPALMPATGTPVPGGLNWQEVNTLIQKTFEHTEVVGADINELRPLKIHHNSEFLCAQLAYRIMGHKAKQACWPLRGESLLEEDSK